MWYTTDVPHFSKVHFFPLYFHKRPAFVPVLTKWRKSKKDFHLYKKKVRCENIILCLF